MRITLIFPPQWTPMNPHFSLATLGGHLRSQGHQVDLLDLNVEFYRHVLTPRYLRYAWGRARNVHDFLTFKAFADHKMRQRTFDCGRDAVRLLAIEKFILEKDELLEQVIADLPRALETFDDEEAFYDPRRLVAAYQTIDQALAIVSLPYSPTELRFNDFQVPGMPLTCEAMRAFAEDTDENPFLRFFESQVERIQADLIGISINAHTQLFGGLTLARLLRRRNIGAHVTLGGNHFVRIQKAITQDERFLEAFADSAVVGEGEKPLDALVEVLGRGGPLSEVPGLVFLDAERKPQRTASAPNVPLDQHAVPSLDGLPLERYFTPRIVFSIRTSKGCYWQKCTFCDTDFGACPDYRSQERIADEVETLGQRYGIQDFCFIDESLRPKYMDELGRLLAARCPQARWYGNARLEPTFSGERLRRMHAGGLTMLLWGLESGSDRIMGLINKGVSLTGRLDVLRAAEAAGVFNFAYVFFGFPSETEEEGMMTIRMLCDRGNAIHAYGRSVFTLGRHTRLAADPSGLGIVEYISDNEELSTTLQYRTRAGDAESEQARRLGERCKVLCAQAYGEPLWMHLRYREVIHLYLRRYGTAYLNGFRFSDTHELQLAGADNP